MKKAMLVWPAPRKKAALAPLKDPQAHEFMDGLSYLKAQGYDVRILDPFPFPLNPFARSGSLLAGLDALRSLRLMFLYFRYDAVISIGCSAGFFFVQLRRLLGFKKPVIVIDPHLSDDYPSRQRLQSYLLPYVDHVIVFGTTQLEHLRELYGGRVRCSFIPHRMDCTFFQPLAKEGLPPALKESHLLCIGNDPQRDFETLFRAAEGCGSKVFVHTKRPLPAVTPANLETSRAWLSFEELRLLYQNASAIVLPLHATTYAGGINTLLEAMAMGKAIIVSDSPGIRDYVQHGDNAWLVPCGDWEALREAMRMLANDPTLAASLGANARRYCMETCAMPVYAERIAAVLNQAAER